MPILMEHKEHGFHNAYSDDEVLELNKQGWNIVKKLKKEEDIEILVKNIKPKKSKTWQ